MQKLQASLEWTAAEEKRIKRIKERNETRSAQLQKWLDLTFGNLHRASNKTTFFYLAWPPLVIFWSVIITAAVPTAIACPKPDGICHNTRMLALEAKKTVVQLPQLLLRKFVRS